MKQCDVFSIWLKYQERIHNYISKRVHQPGESENILHTVLLKMYRYCEKSNDVKNVSSWLYQIASNAIVDYYRNRQKFTEMNIDNLPLVDAEIPVSNAKEWVRPLIAQIPGKYADLLVMADLEGMGQKEIADKKGLTLTATKSRIQRGRKKLEEKFRECGVVEHHGDQILFTATKPCCKQIT
jgi:RNA polymerase sigma-70 factor, ECF subfamily